MNVKARICKLEQTITPKRPEVFIYRSIVSPELKDETGPAVIGVNFRAGGELVHLDRGEGEKLDDLHARMRAIGIEKTGAKSAIALNEIVRET